MKRTISPLKANLYGILISFVMSFSLVIIAIYIWDLTSFEKLKNWIKVQYSGVVAELPLWGLLLLIFLISILGIVLHECMHGFFFAIKNKKGIKLKFGILWSALAPYCHCTEPLKRNDYMIAVLMPFIVLGLIPLGFSLYLNNIWIFIFGLMFICAASGDLIIFYGLMKEKKDSWIKDHPEEIGYILMEDYLD